MSGINNKNSKRYLDWVEVLKAFAILAILLNHVVESYGDGPWFSNPSNTWPDLNTRMGTIFPQDPNIFTGLIKFSGWLGDMGPGIFILLSGFTLTYSALTKNTRLSAPLFYRNRFLRIWPLYFIIHSGFLFFFWLLGNPDQLVSPKIALSLFGIRANEELFFYMNPSWWFLWLIIQFYFIFPVLYKLLLRNEKWFLIITLCFTLASRLAGILNLTYCDNLYFWMTGLFFGTRLFEFTLGMFLAKLLIERKISAVLSKPRILFVISICIYITGFCCSLFYYTTLFSNILITVGLCGIFFSLWKVLVKLELKIAVKALKYIGKASFPVFIIHQPFLHLITENSGHYTSITLIIIFLILLFPLSIFFEKKLTLSLTWLTGMDGSKTIIKIASLSILLNIITSFIYFYFNYRYFFILSGFLTLISLIILLMNRNLSNKEFIKSLAVVNLSSIMLFLFILSGPWSRLYWIISLSIIFLSFLLNKIHFKWNKSIYISAISLYIMMIFLEIYFVSNRPLESDKWGEYNALCSDPVTGYNLIPDKVTQLTYNNYNYTVKTNHLGFNSPELHPENMYEGNNRIFVTGDAFTMPEGYEYEKAYPFLLEQKLRAYFRNDDIEVINGGVTGFGPNEMMAQIKKFVPILKPALVINQVFINEFSEINLSVNDRLISIGLNTDRLLNRMYYGQIPVYFEKFVIHKVFPSEKNTYTEGKSLVNYYKSNSDFYDQPTLEKLENYFVEMKNFCSQWHCEYIVLFVPSQLEIEKKEFIEYYPSHLNLAESVEFDMTIPDRIFSNMCNKNGIKYLNPAETLKNYKTHPLYNKHSWHWNNEGHYVISDFLANYIINLTAFQREINAEDSKL